MFEVRSGLLYNVQGDRKVEICTIIQKDCVGTSAPARPLVPIMPQKRATGVGRPYTDLCILTTNAFLCDRPIIMRFST